MFQERPEPVRRGCGDAGNATLGIVAGMLHEITDRHTEAAVVAEGATPSPAAYRKLMRSYARLLELVRAGDAAGAEAHWREHMRVSGDLLLRGRADIRLVDVLH